MVSGHGGLSVPCPAVDRIFAHREAELFSKIVTVSEKAAVLRLTFIQRLLELLARLVATLRLPVADELGQIGQR